MKKRMTRQERDIAHRTLLDWLLGATPKQIERRMKRREKRKELG